MATRGGIRKGEVDGMENGFQLLRSGEKTFSGVRRREEVSTSLRRRDGMWRRRKRFLLV